MVAGAPSPDARLWHLLLGLALALLALRLLGLGLHPVMDTS